MRPEHVALIVLISSDRHWKAITQFFKIPHQFPNFAGFDTFE